MTIFLTGGSSSLGEIVLPRLLREDRRVRALARSPTAASRVQRLGAEVVEGDLQESGWHHALRRADAVVHLAGITLAPDLARLVDSMQPLVIVSSASATNPAHPLSASIRRAEEAVLEAVRGTVHIVRPTMIYGSPRDRNVRLLARLITRIPVVPRLVGGGVIQPVLADDVAGALLPGLSTRQSAVFNLGGPDTVTLGTLIDQLSSILGRWRIPMPVPVAGLTAIARIGGRIRQTRSLHALEMLRHDRTVETPEPELWAGSRTSLQAGLRIAIARYRL